MQTAAPSMAARQRVTRRSGSSFLGNLSSLDARAEKRVGEWLPRHRNAVFRPCLAADRDTVRWEAQEGINVSPVPAFPAAREMVQAAARFGRQHQQAVYNALGGDAPNPERRALLRNALAAVRSGLDRQPTPICAAGFAVLWRIRVETDPSSWATLSQAAAIIPAAGAKAEEAGADVASSRMSYSRFLVRL